MKSKIIFLAVFVSLVGSISYCQNAVLKDTLIKSTRVSANGELKISYEDITSPNILPMPLDKSKDIPELINFKISSVEKLVKIAEDIFTKEEIVKLIESTMIIDCKVLPSGEIVNASILFSEKDPHVCLKNLIHFSMEIKEKLIVTPIFSEKIEVDGYVKYYIFAYEVL